MNEKQTASGGTVRPTKKQRELLAFIERFITEHGYSPSYREIMAGLNYTSVATVALHIGSLIKRGHLRKRDYSARSLELTRPGEAVPVTTNEIMPAEEKWLVAKVEHLFVQAESDAAADMAGSLAALVQALHILGLDAAAHSFEPRLAAYRQRRNRGS